jgi:hypothetical protein
MGTSQPIDVRDMAIVHRTFREGYREAARLVRAATTSDTRVAFWPITSTFASRCCTSTTRAKTNSSIRS